MRYQFDDIADENVHLMEYNSRSEHFVLRTRNA